eukprot:452493-Pleurochrysis_carterae.AAC.1
MQLDGFQVHASLSAALRARILDLALRTVTLRLRAIGGGRNASPVMRARPRHPAAPVTPQRIPVCDLSRVCACGAA